MSRYGRTFCDFALCLAALALAGIACRQTVLVTSKTRTFELLSVHSETCPHIPFDRDSAKIVMFSDLHRGMGVTDEFRANKALFERILNHFYDTGYTLVLIGDIEEGWGFQRDNVPIILDDHRPEIEVEKKFFLDHRYIRVFGNHDDYYRGQHLFFDDTTQVRVYPAVVLEQVLSNGKAFTILITHGCQGQGLADAGDDLAAQAVNIKYLWLLETSGTKYRSADAAIKAMEKAQANYEKHEQYMLDWAFGGLAKKCSILIAGHTHRPVFNSVLEPKFVSIVKKDYESGARTIPDDLFITYPKGAETPSRRDRDRGVSLSSEYQKKMLAKLTQLELMEPKTLSVPSADRSGKPAYFNTGCGLFSKIPCIEISGGKIRLTYISQGAGDGLMFDTKGEADLKDFD
jgi:UDP-2,3-diacylglucosamine pyrophosphatase LpxH